MATVTLTPHQPVFDDVDTDTAGGSASLSLDVPAGAAVGDQLVLALTIRADRDFDIDGSDLGGFELVTNTDDGEARLGVFTKEVILGEPGTTYTFGCTGGNSAWAGALVNYSDVGRLAYSSFDPGDATFPAFVGDGLGAVVADQPVLAVAVMGYRGNDAITLTPPAGFDERADVCNPSGGLRVAVGVSDYAPDFTDVGAVWQGSGTGGAAGRVVGWLLFVGSTDMAISGLPTNPNEVTPLSVPFADGVHTLYAGWGGGVLLVEANIGGSTFRLDDDVYGRLDGDGRLGPTDDGWVDLGCDLLELSQVAGATDDAGMLSRSEAGLLTLTLSDWASKWDPMNLDSPVAQDWQLGCRVRVCFSAFESLEQMHDVATDVIGQSDSWFTPIFTGRIESMVVAGMENDDQTVTVEVVDDIPILAAANPLAQSPVGGGDTIDERVQRILTNVGSSLELGIDPSHPEWPGTGADAPYEYQSTTLAQPAWTEILLTCDAALCIPVMRGDGMLALTPQAPNSVFYRDYKVRWDEGEGLVSVEVENNRNQLRNVVNFAAIDSTMQSAVDPASITRQGGRFEYSRGDFPLAHDADVADVAQRLLVRSSDPAPRVTSIGFWPQLFGSNLFHVFDIWFDGTVIGTANAPLYSSLAHFISVRHANEEMLTVRWPNPRSGLEREQIVMIRGHELRITPDEWQVRFVTSSVDSWFDIFTLSDPSDSDAAAEQSRLDRGHRLAAAYAS